MTQLEQDIKDKEQVVKDAETSLNEAVEWYTLQVEELLTLKDEKIKENEF